MWKSANSASVMGPDGTRMGSQVNRLEDGTGANSGGAGATESSAESARATTPLPSHARAASSASNAAACESGRDIRANLRALRDAGTPAARREQVIRAR